MSKLLTNPDLPLAGDGYFLTDGGIETTLIFHDGIDLPLFASFVLLETEDGRRALTDYFERHIAVARAHRLGFILESPTWRSSRDWGQKLGYSAGDLDRINAEAIYLMRTLRNRHIDTVSPLVISGCVGPKGDGYVPGELMTATQARDYHAPQIAAMTTAGADMITAITMNNTPEAKGIALPQKILPFRLLSPLPWKPMVPWRPVSRWRMPSARSTRPPAVTRSTTWSIAPTRIISTMCCRRVPTG